MKFSFRRLGAVLRKELREYRRSPFILVTMAVLPLVFLIEPLLTIFRIGRWSRLVRWIRPSAPRFSYC